MTNERAVSATAPVLEVLDQAGDPAAERRCERPVIRAKRGSDRTMLKCFRRSESGTDWRFVCGAAESLPLKQPSPNTGFRDAREAIDSYGTRCPFEQHPSRR
jgi:hypothetical protein